VAYFEENLRSLKSRDPLLADKLAKAYRGSSGPVHCQFLKARNGDPVPAIRNTTGIHPLHSLVDPRREAARLIASLGDEEEFLIFFGLGGGYSIEAALERRGTGRVLVVEYGLPLLAETLCLRDLRGSITDPRVVLLVDPPPEFLEECITKNYLPALSGAIRVLPLRPRTDAQPQEFAGAAAAVQRAINSITADYSVQAHFGKRWFSNILRNVKNAGGDQDLLPRVQHAIVCAAGPSLETQIPVIAENREGAQAKAGRGERPYLIAADTSLPALLHAGIKPDAVVSIDCQHISYYHFIPRGSLKDIPLFLDLASPALLASLAPKPIFFSSGHPLTGYISSRWRYFPAVDTSGGNVTYAAVSLAEALGATEIELYGADFSYPRGRTYARGTYIFPYFEIRQNRLSPLEGLFSRFLYRGPLEKITAPQAETWYYETETLRRYRQLLEAKAERMAARLHPVPGLGAPITIKVPGTILASVTMSKTVPGTTAEEFLTDYREKIRNLPPVKNNPSEYLAGLGNEDRQVLTTLLPLAAALRRKEQNLRGAEIIERTQDYSITAINRVL
jgi:hypothetical protein